MFLKNTNSWANVAGWLIAIMLLLPAIKSHAETGIYYIHNDHLGTPQVVTDQAQSVVWQANYSPFGEVDIVTEEVTLDARFPGQYADEVSGLYYNYFRDYDPTTGRYIQSDPIGLNGGINTYGYVLQNPVRYTDPKGLYTQTIGYGIGRVAVGPAIDFGLGLLGLGTLGVAIYEATNDEPDITAPVDRQADANARAGGPPGNCSNDELRRLQSDVNTYCKGNGMQSCSVIDSCPTLEAKLTLNRQCALAREKVNNRCFAGGDAGHQQQASAAWNAVQRCTTAISANGCTGENCDLF